MVEKKKLEIEGLFNSNEYRISVKNLKILLFLVIIL